MVFFCCRKLTGWKKAATVNCIVLMIMSMTFLACLVLSIVKAGCINKVLFFSEAKCTTGKATQVNVLLHVLINVVSTVVVSQTILLPA